jgi:hypothetical protein
MAQSARIKLLTAVFADARFYYNQLTNPKEF